MTTAERMKARRKEIGVSAEEIAKELKVSPATIYRYEKGDIEKMPLEILEPLSKVLRTTPAYLMGWEEPESESNIVKKKYEIGGRLRYFRELRGLSQKELASLIGVSNSRVSNWEQGINRPDADILASICNSLHISADELLDINSSTNKLGSLSTAELEHIKKYRRIDSDGKKTIDMMLDQLVKAAGYSEKHPDMVTLPLASRGGGLSEVTVTEEAVKKLEEAQSEDIDF